MLKEKDTGNTKDIEDEGYQYCLGDSTRRIRKYNGKKKGRLLDVTFKLEGNNWDEMLKQAHRLA